MMMLPLLCSRMGESPLPPELSVLGDLHPIVLKALAQKGPRPIWLETSGAWNMVWGQETFGLGERPVDTFRFRFRVPPDATATAVGGKPPFVLEAYQNGFPTMGIRRDREAESARPLGFRYRLDGLCDNVEVFLFGKTGWKAQGLSRMDKTNLGRYLNANEYAAEFGPMPQRSRFGAPWIRIAVKGYGDYWIDHDLNAVGPFGANARLFVEFKNDIRTLVEGRN